LTTLDPFAESLAGMRNDDHKALEDHNFRPGVYQVTTVWINVRQDSFAESPLLVRLPQGATLPIIAFKTDDDGRVRGLAAQGGWVSIVTDGGSTYFERVADLTIQTLSGEFRMIQLHAAPVHASPDSNGAPVDTVEAGSEFDCQNVSFSEDGTVFGQLSTGNWVMLYSLERGLVAEAKLRNWNDVERRKPQKDQVGHQMMLPTDMVMKWDPTFRKHLEVYGKDDGENKLREDFGKAFKKLTELGCYWSSEAVVV